MNALHATELYPWNYLNGPKGGKSPRDRKQPPDFGRELGVGPAFQTQLFLPISHVELHGNGQVALTENAHSAKPNGAEPAASTGGRRPQSLFQN